MEERLFAREKRVCSTAIAFDAERKAKYARNYGDRTAAAAIAIEKIRSPRRRRRRQQRNRG